MAKLNVSGTGNRGLSSIRLPVSLLITEGTCSVYTETEAGASTNRLFIGLALITANFALVTVQQTAFTGSVQGVYGEY